MASLDTIDRLLSIASALIDRAASEIRDAKFEPVHENIEFIGRALGEIFALQHRIYALRPDLAPESLAEPSKDFEANRLLAAFVLRASELERAGDIAGAVAEFERFLKMESSRLHTEIAVGEIKRLNSAARS